MLCCCLFASFFLPLFKTCTYSDPRSKHIIIMQFLLSEHYNKQTSHPSLVLPISCWFHPEMDKSQNYYLLHFRGILFAFPLWTAQVLMQTHTHMHTHRHTHTHTHTHVLCAQYSTVVLQGYILQHGYNYVPFTVLYTELLTVYYSTATMCSQSGYSPSAELGELLEADSYGSLVLSRLCLFSGNITDPADARSL